MVSTSAVADDDSASNNSMWRVFQPFCAPPRRGWSHVAGFIGIEIAIEIEVPCLFDFDLDRLQLSTCDCPGGPRSRGFRAIGLQNQSIQFLVEGFNRVGP
jgi:hypothetical protein